jgi:hypothetical protein
MRGLSRLGISGPAAALVLYCRRDPPHAVGDTPPDFREPAFQSDLAQLAQRHGVYGLLLHTLQRTGVFAALPAAVVREHEDALRLLRRHAALWDLERDFVLGLLAERAVPAVLLKGAALRLTSYRDSVQRSFGDLDVLVPDDAVDQAVAALGEAGYQSLTESRASLYLDHHHHLILRKPMGFVVEVHWALEPVDSPFALEPQAFRRSAVAYPDPQGHPVLVPVPEHNVLHLSTQSMEDGYSRFSRIVDLDRVIASRPQAVDWERLAEEAIRMQVSTPVAVSLRLAELLLGTAIPAGFFERLDLAPLCRTNLALLDPVTALLEQRSQRRAAVERLFLLWCVQGGPARTRVLKAVYWGEQDWFAQMGFLQSEVIERVSRRRHPLAILKLLAYQAWIYLAAMGAPLRGRRIAGFWKSPPAG